ncbi:MAG: SPOR domain-containing protein [Polaribacter sp.]|nr:SPOR domain-containing protein [Polaribacter sp.]
MKSKRIAPLFLFFFIAISHSTYSQKKTTKLEEIKNIISKKRNFNKEFGFGYSIQLYNGNEQQARQILTRFNVDFPDRFSKLVYNSPEWKVQVGNYKTKLEADKDLIKFQKKITGIIVVPMGK